MFDFMLCGGIISVLFACIAGAITSSFNWHHMYQVYPILMIVSALSVAASLFIFLSLQLIQPVLVGGLRCLEIVLALAIDMTVAAITNEFEQGFGGMHTIYKVTGSLIVTLAVMLLGIADDINQQIFS